MTQQARALLTLPIQAAGAIQPFRLVGFDGLQATLLGQPIAGVSRRAAAAQDWTDLVVMGTAVVESGAALAPGAPVVSNNLGRAVTATALAAAGTGLTVAAGATGVTSSAANGAIVGGTATLSGSAVPQHIFGRVAPGNSASAAGEFVEIILMTGGG